MILFCYLKEDNMNNIYNRVFGSHRKKRNGSFIPGKLSVGN